MKPVRVLSKEDKVIIVNKRLYNYLQTTGVVLTIVAFSLLVAKIVVDFI